MSAAKRLSKRQLRDDKFVDVMMHYADKIRENQRLLVGGVVVLLILILALNWGRNAMRAADVEAQQTFSTALKTLETAMADETQSTYGEPQRAFEAIGEEFAGKDVGKWSMYYVGFCLEQQKEYLEAEKVYENYLSEDPGGEFEIAARLGIATCNAGVGRYKRQADFLVELAGAEGISPTQADAWRFQAGQVYLDNGYFDLARQVMTDIVDRVDEPTRLQIEQILEALSGIGS